MYIGNDKIVGNIKLGALSWDSGGTGYSDPLPVNTKEAGHIGTLYLTKESNENITYVEWCKGNYVQGAGIKIELQELIEFLESRESQD